MGLRRRSDGWIGPYARAVFQEHPARSLMAAVGTVILLAATTRWIVDPDGSVWGLAIVFGGGLLLTVAGFGAAFVEEVVIGKESRLKMRGLSPKPAIDASTVGERVSDDLERGIVPTVHVGELDDALRFFIADAAIRQLFSPQAGPLEHCRLHLYLWDDTDKLLRATLESDHDLSWERGHGVVGVAWDTGRRQLATGAECHDGTFGLTPAEQARHATLYEVAAEPVFDDDGETLIAILSASNATDVPRLSTAAGTDELRVLAYAMTRLMIDLLKWQAISTDT